MMKRSFSRLISSATQTRTNNSGTAQTPVYYADCQRSQTDWLERQRRRLEAHFPAVPFENIEQNFTSFCEELALAMHEYTCEVINPQEDVKDITTLLL